MMTDISVVIPLLNEAESIPELTDWIIRVATENKLSYEIVFVDDGCKDLSWQIISDLAKSNSAIRGIKFRRNYGKSAALNEGFKAAIGNVIITMDADLQDSPDEIPELYKMVAHEGYDLVSGWKRRRFDPLSKTLPTKLFNGVTRSITKIKLHDFNCGLKAYSHKVVKSIEVFGEMHRFVPVLAKGAGFNNIGEKVVQHQARKYGFSKYMGWNRFVNGLLDLFTITFLTRFGKRPMHFFGFWGLMLFILGFFISGYMAFAKFYFDDYSLTNRPLFLVALVIMLMGSIFFLTGFLAELLLRNSPERNNYLVEETKGFNEYGLR